MQRNHILFLALVCIMVITAGCTSAPRVSTASQPQPSPRIPFANAQFISNATLVTFLPDHGPEGWAITYYKLEPAGLTEYSQDTVHNQYITGTRAHKTYETQSKRVEIYVEDSGNTNSSFYLSAYDLIQRKDLWEKHPSTAKIEIGTVRGNPSVIQYLTTGEGSSYNEFIIVNDRIVVLIEGSYSLGDRALFENAIDLDGLKALT